MLKYNIEKRYDLSKINKNLYYIKSKLEFEKEFDFKKGIELG